MDLTLIRHAIAEVGEDDAARSLSRKGRRRFAQEVAALEALGLRFDRVLHSPLLRALETAELLAPLCDGELEVTPLLTQPPGPALLERLAGDAVAVVGHEPHLSALLAWLLTGSPEAGAAFELKKGAVARLTGERAPGGMRLLALLPPAVLREAAP